MLKYSNSKMFKYSNFQMFRCSDDQILNAKCQIATVEFALTIIVCFDAINISLVKVVLF